MKFVFWVIILPVLCYYALFVFCKFFGLLVCHEIYFLSYYFVFKFVYILHYFFLLFLICLLLIGRIQFFWWQQPLFHSIFCYCIFEWFGCLNHTCEPKLQITRVPNRRFQKKGLKCLLVHFYSLQNSYTLQFLVLRKTREAGSRQFTTVLVL